MIFFIHFSELSAIVTFRKHYLAPCLLRNTNCIPDQQLKDSNVYGRPME